MILYPTETIYALGVNALNKEELAKLYACKGRDESKPVSWLVRDICDIERFAILSPLARKVSERFLPGPLTLVLPARDFVPKECLTDSRLIGFRISPDQVSKRLIAEYFALNDAPLTCTSANISGQETATNVTDILEQFGDKSSYIDNIYDDGPRFGVPSTVVQVIGSQIDILRFGAIPATNLNELIE